MTKKINKLNQLAIIFYNNYDSDCDEEVLAIDSYKAGFEKAKELAIKIAFDFDDHTVANKLEKLGE